MDFLLPSIDMDQALASGHALIVPNARLVRVLKQRLGLWHQPEATVLRTAPVFTLNDWLDRALSDAEWAGRWQPDLPQRLDDDSERLLWQRVLAETEGDSVLLDRDAAADLAMDTWKLVQHWQVPLHSERFAEEEWQRFRHWLARFHQISRREKVIDATAWLKRLLRQLPPNALQAEPLVLVGFIEFSVLEQQLLQALQAQGFSLFEAKAPQQVNEPTRQACDSVAEELLAAARWAEAQLQANPQAQVAVLVNDLGHWRDEAERSFEAVFHPGAALQPLDDLRRRYNLALGHPLADAPLIATVLHWLDWLAAPHRAQERAWISRLLLLPFCSGWREEYTARARFDAWLRSEGLLRLSLVELQSQFQRWQQKHPGQAVQFGALLQRVLALSPRSDVDGVLQLLEAIGWPGDGLGMVEQRTANAFYRQLETWQDVARWLPPQRQAGLQWLRRRCREALHQASGSDNAPVQVLGLIDAVGRRFDAVWVANLTADNWPASPRPNPLIPQPLQSRLPHAHSSREREYAERLFAQLCGLAEVMVCSYASRDGDREQAPSPLIAGFADAGLPKPEAAGLAGLVRTRWQTEGREAPWLDWEDDAQGSPPPIDAVPGGPGLLRDQAISPLAGWARHALKVRPLDTPDDELDAAEHGSLLHKSLQLFWERLRTQAALLALTDVECEQAISTAVETALTDFEREERSLPQRYRQLEAARLTRKLRDWLLRERERAPFTVLHIEHTVRLNISGLCMEGRVDRVDQLADGSLLIIDYKTGNVKARDWLGDSQHDNRLLQPQLPVYTQAEWKAPLAGLVFALLREDHMGWEGVATAAAGLPVLAPGNKDFSDFPDWDALQTHWQQQLSALAKEVQAGRADALVYDDKGVVYSPVRLLLRQPQADWERRHRQPGAGA